MRRAVVVVLCVAILAWWAWPRDVKPEEAPVAAAPKGTRLAVPRPAGRPARAAAARPARAAPAVAPVVAPAEGVVADGAAGSVEQREAAERELFESQRLVYEQTTEVSFAVRRCTAQWVAAEPTLGEEVSLRFAFDADGLQDVWVEGRATAPDAVMSCFSDVVWAQDWSGISEWPSEVSFPLRGPGSAPEEGELSDERFAE